MDDTVVFNTGTTISDVVEEDVALPGGKGTFSAFSEEGVDEVRDKLDEDARNEGGNGIWFCCNKEDEDPKDASEDTGIGSEADDAVEAEPVGVDEGIGIADATTDGSLNAVDGFCVTFTGWEVEDVTDIDVDDDDEVEGADGAIIVLEEDDGTAVSLLTCRRWGAAWI